jgi:hypothetical protein
MLEENKIILFSPLTLVISLMRIVFWKDNELLDIDAKPKVLAI